MQNLLNKSKEELVLKIKELQDKFDSVAKNQEQQMSFLRSTIDSLSENKQMLNNVLSHFPGVVFWKDKNSVYLGCNKTFATAAGLDSPSEIVGLSDYDLPWATTEADNYRSDDAQVINSQQPKLHIIEKQHQANGKVTWFDTSKLPLYDSSMKVIGILGVSNDITSLKQYELELIKARDAAEEGNRLKTNFLNNMSHEVRTPLNAISGFAQLITKPGIPEDKLLKYSEMINNSSKKLLQIIFDIIEVSQLQANSIEVYNKRFNFIELIDEIIEYGNAQIIGKNIKLICKKDSLNISHYVSGDQNRIGVMLRHLIDNAIKFTEEGFVELDFDLSATEVGFKVADSGIGIPPEMLNKIFEPFVQIETGTCRNYGGNGIGLTIVKAYTELFNGKLTIASEINKGTTITIKLPIKEVKETENASPKKTTHLMNGNSILIVEDEYTNYLYLAELLSESNYNILYAENGKKAIECCKNENIDLVFMDIKMPIMDGITATKIIKELLPRLPIVAQTAFALTSEKEKFNEVGFDDYICKPITENVLFSTIKKFIAN